PNCVVTLMHTGMLEVDIKTAADGTASGTGEFSQTRTVTQTQGNCGAAANTQVGYVEMDGCCNPSPGVHGTAANLTFTGSHPGNAGTNWSYLFTGALNGAEIAGTFVLTVTQPGQPFNPSFPVTLQK